MMETSKLSRDQIKLMASGKYIDLYKSFDQQQHASFIEGATYIYDLINSQKKVENANERTSEKRIQSELQN